MLLVAGVLVAFVAIYIRGKMSDSSNQPQVASQRVMVAKRDINPGSAISVPQDADWEVQPDEIKNKETVIREDRNSAEEVNGAIARRMIKTAEPLEMSMLSKSSGGGLMSAVLEPGMRAVSISVTATSGNAGFVLPGDYVDLILTRELTRSVSNGRESETRKNIYSKTFVEKVRVLAADQMIDNPENKAIVAKTITVEVTPDQAQMIAVATDLGKISMSLRSANDNGHNDASEKVAPITAPAANQTISDADVSGENGQEISEPVRVMRNGEVQNLEFFRRPTVSGEAP